MEGGGWGKWGHLRLKTLLRGEGERKREREGGEDGKEESSPSSPCSCPQTKRLFAQISSLGSMGSSPSHFLTSNITPSFSSFSSSYSSTTTTPQPHAISMFPPPPPLPIDIIWPTVSCVRNSIQGWRAGASLPCRSSTLYASTQEWGSNSVRPFLSSKLRVWEGVNGMNRGRITPHIKTFGEYRVHQSSCELLGGEEKKDEEEEEVNNEERVELSWFLLSSHNLSKSAWGSLQKGESQISIPSFELGVLILPTNNHLEENYVVKDDVENAGTISPFSLTPNHPILGSSSVSPLRIKRIWAAGSDERMGLWERGEGGLPLNEVYLPIPHKLPAPLYSPEDRPWVWDKSYKEQDMFGQEYIYRE